MTSEQNADRRLDEQLESLRRDIRPETDLWAQLEPQLGDRVAQKSSQPRRTPFWAAAASVLLVGLLLVLNYEPQTESEVALVPEHSAEVQVIMAYETAIAEQLHVLHNADRNWGDVSYQLEVFRSAVAEIRFALSFQPHNPALLQQLQDVYQQQLAWLQAVSSYNSVTLS